MQNISLISQYLEPVESQSRLFRDVLWCKFFIAYAQGEQPHLFWLTLVLNHFLLAMKMSWVQYQTCWEKSQSSADWFGSMMSVLCYRKKTSMIQVHALLKKSLGIGTDESVWDCLKSVPRKGSPENILHGDKLSFYPPYSNGKIEKIHSEEIFIIIKD